MLLFKQLLRSLLAVTTLGARSYEHCACASCTPGGSPATIKGRTVESDSSSAHHPFPPKGSAHVRNDTLIHVMISSYRDPRCGQSLFNVFDRATHPNRMAVGIVEQTLSGADTFDCVATYCAIVAETSPSAGGACPHLERISTVRVDAATALGPIWARAMGAPMVQPQHEFCMQLDAHVDFNVGYDVSMMKMWAMAGNEYGVLSTYVGNIVQDLSASGEVLIGAPRYDVPVICGTIVGAHGVVRNKGADGGQCLATPQLSLAWAAGWSFAKCHFERNVPNDPHLEGLFDGEEFSRMLRAFTHGYDVYTPHRPIVFHDYRHGLPWQKKREGTWGRNNDPSAAVKRYFELVRGQLPHGDAWGLGERRTIEQFYEFSGINARTSKQNDDGRCHKLRYTPFVEDPALATQRATPLYAEGGLPGNLTLDSSIAPLPPVDPQYVRAARSMREQMKRQAPPIATATQAREFGEPRVELWAQLIATERARASGGAVRGAARLTGAATQAGGGGGQALRTRTRVVEMQQAALPSEESSSMGLSLVVVPLVAAVALLALGCVQSRQCGRRRSGGDGGKGA